jgi:hypothetical protein
MQYIKILNYKKIKRKTVKGRVNIGRSHSELAVVGAQHEAYIEEHPRVANRNLYRE